MHNLYERALQLAQTTPKVRELVPLYPTERARIMVEWITSLNQRAFQRGQCKTKYPNDCDQKLREEVAANSVNFDTLEEVENTFTVEELRQIYHPMRF